MSDKKIAKDLDAALEGAEPTPELEPLVEVAARLEDGMDVDAPTASRERALFTRGVGVRKKGFNPLRVVSPALAVVGLVAIVAFVAGRALPGQTLYPVREAMDSVGLANLPEEEFQDHIDDADRLLAQSAGALGSDEPSRAESLALRAMIELEAARGLIDELDRSNRAEAEAEVDRLFGEARTLITSSIGLRSEGDDDDSSGPGSGDEDDSSGPGSGDDDDSSGPGSGGEDSSGPGSGGEDSSGPGSGDEDSSGSGSGDGDGSGSDSGSSGSGSGGGDSSGPGSGSG